ncbi:hypothetical protein F442_04386 [Phytophthora nicotianae P10297]|uniref:Uncharacterized protein n=1 Tax=Phytophthora nicotianae P10297 TaxID=1317064 RepID=W2ZT92_PHYNI|nr:hypothetical protein F442_04386 [Phytophthora nicotianae P10297]
MDGPGYQDGAGGGIVAADEENVTDATASTATSSEQRSRKRSDIWDFIEETLNGAYSCRCCTQAD